jgi:hypothetical protein
MAWDTYFSRYAWRSDSLAYFSAVVLVTRMIYVVRRTQDSAQQGSLWSTITQTVNTATCVSSSVPATVEIVRITREIVLGYPSRSHLDVNKCWWLQHSFRKLWIVVSTALVIGGRACAAWILANNDANNFGCGTILLQKFTRYHNRLGNMTTKRSRTPPWRSSRAIALLEERASLSRWR